MQQDSHESGFGLFDLLLAMLFFSALISPISRVKVLHGSLLAYPPAILSGGLLGALTVYLIWNAFDKIIGRVGATTGWRSVLLGWGMITIVLVSLIAVNVAGAALAGFFARHL